MTHTVDGAAEKRARHIKHLHKPYRWSLPIGARETLDFVSAFLVDEAHAGRLHEDTHRLYVAAVVEGAMIGILARADLVGRDYGRLHRLYSDTFSLLFYGAARCSREELVDTVLMLSGLMTDAARPRPLTALWAWRRRRFYSPEPFISRELLKAQVRL